MGTHQYTTGVAKVWRWLVWEPWCRTKKWGRLPRAYVAVLTAGWPEGRPLHLNLVFAPPTRPSDKLLISEAFT